MKPFFSIIIPLYNSAKTLQATLDSIAAQEFKSLEVIYMDGASTDGTLKMITDFKEAHAELQTVIFSEPDKGIYDAMNKGIGVAKGDWLYFMGGDDKFQSNDVLHKIQQIAGRDELDLIHGNVTGASSNNRYCSSTLSQILFEGIHHQGIFYKRSVFSFTGGYDLKFKIAADYYLTLKAFLNKAFKTRYEDIDIAYFGETGLSSQQHDWMFYSYHYRFLAKHQAIDEPDTKAIKCLNDSIYACYQLAKNKQSLLFAWQNLVSYTFFKNGLKFGSKARNMMRMCYWTLKPKE